jgi:hypothetical protein
MAANVKKSAFSERQVSLAIVAIIVAVALIAAVFAWWRNSSVNPTRVFWGAVQNSLSTRGVTVSESASANGEATSETSQFDFGPSQRALTITTFTEGSAEVRTLELSTPNADYTKYLTIKESGAAISAANLKQVIGVWGNTTSSTKSKDTNVPSTFPSALLQLAMPFGNFSAAQQATLMNQAQTQQVYTPDIAHVQKKTVDGRLEYEYSVTMQPILYVQLMKIYAQAMGMHDLDSIDPNSYASDGATEMQWTIDAHSRQVLSVAYAGHTENYSGYGLNITTPTPTNVISGATLQTRINALNARIQ